MVGRGEVAPLQGFSVDDLASAHEQVGELLPRLTEVPLLEIDTEKLLPSVRCGLEMAIQALAWQQKDLAAHETGRSVRLNGLVMSDQTDLLPAVSALLNEGYTAIKVKVAREPLDRDIATIREIRGLAADRALLRLDANGRWSLEEAVAFGQAVGTAGIDYIEEPVADLDQYPSFYEQTGMPLALDARDPAVYVPRTGVTTWVLKPAILGGVGICRRLCQTARELGLRVVLSSLFESAHALRFYARLALALDLADIPQGLDTWRWLMEAKGITVRGGRIEL